MSLAPVGSLYQTGDADTLAVSPSAVGDILVLFYGGYVQSFNLDGVSGGGVAEWNGPYNSPATGPGNVATSMAWGVITETGDSDVTITSEGDDWVHSAWAVQQFTGGVFALDDFAELSLSDTTSDTYPELTPVSTPELYAGVVYTSFGSTGDDAGFTYTDGLSGGDAGANVSLVWGLDATFGVAQAPAWDQGGPGYASGVSLLLRIGSASSSNQIVMLV